MTHRGVYADSLSTQILADFDAGIAASKQIIDILTVRPPAVLRAVDGSSSDEAIKQVLCLCCRVNSIRVARFTH